MRSEVQKDIRQKIAARVNGKVQPPERANEAQLEAFAEQHGDGQFASFNDIPPHYSWAPSSSKTVEAMLNAIALILDDKVQGKSALSDDARAAVAQMWEFQRDDGSWEWIDVGYEPWESEQARYFGAAMVAIAIGEAPAESQQDLRAASGFARLKKFLRNSAVASAVNLHAKAFILWAAALNKDLLSPKEKDKVKRDLLDARNADGSWSLKRLVGDVGADSHPYATAAVLLALHADGASAEERSSGTYYLRQLVDGGKKIQAQSLRSASANPQIRGNMFMSDAANAYASLYLARVKGEVARGNGDDSWEATRLEKVKAKAIDFPRNVVSWGISLDIWGGRYKMNRLHIRKKAGSAELTVRIEATGKGLSLSGPPAPRVKAKTYEISMAKIPLIDLETLAKDRLTKNAMVAILSEIKSQGGLRSFSIAE